MKLPDRRHIRIFTVLIISTAYLLFLYSPLGSAVIHGISTKELASAIFYLGTGRHAVFLEEERPPETTEPEVSASPIVFQSEDADRLRFYNYADVSFDAQSLLQQPLTWDLTDSAPTVLIYHTHATESYENTENYLESSDHRTLDERYNMVSIGDRLAKRLEDAGIHVIHDRTLHDYPNYNTSYTSAKNALTELLAANPSICLVLDLHRDAYTDGKGKLASATITANGIETSRLMLLTGTNAAGEKHPNWKSNLAFATKLQTVLETQTPGLCRPICIRSAAFNQFLCPGAILVEVGNAGDTRQNALAAADLLADAIIALAQGSQSFS